MKTTGFRILARREAERVRLFTRHGTDFTARYPKIAAAVESLPVRSCALDGEAIVVNQDGLSIFDLIRYRQNDIRRALCLRPDRTRQQGPSVATGRAPQGRACRSAPRHERRIAFNTHFAGDGATILGTLALGCEGRVQRLGSPFALAASIIGSRSRTRLHPQ